jgi:hypothetical protein
MARSLLDKPVVSQVVKSITVFIEPEGTYRVYAVTSS